MGLIKKTRGNRQAEHIDAPNVWIEDPKGTGQLILVKKSDLDEKGFLIDDDDDDDEGVEGDGIA